MTTLGCYANVIPESKMLPRFPEGPAKVMLQIFILVGLVVTYSLIGSSNSGSHVALV